MTNTEAFLIEIKSPLFRVDSNHIKCADPENFSQRWRGGRGGGGPESFYSHQVIS